MLLKTGHSDPSRQDLPDFSLRRSQTKFDVKNLKKKKKQKANVVL
jgi:hypothetical protein